jgi:hypothetical protein
MYFGHTQFKSLLDYQWSWCFQFSRWCETACWNSLATFTTLYTIHCYFQMSVYTDLIQQLKQYHKINQIPECCKQQATEKLWGCQQCVPFSLPEWLGLYWNLTFLQLCHCFTKSSGNIKFSSIHSSPYPFPV